MRFHYVRILVASALLACLAQGSGRPVGAAISGPGGERAYRTPGGQTVIVPGPNQGDTDATKVGLLTDAQMKLLEQAGYKLDQIKKDQIPGKARLSEYDVYTAGGKLYVGPKGQAGVPLSSFRGTSTGLTFNAMKAAVNTKFGIGIGRGGVRSGGGRTPQPPGGGAGREAGRELE